MKIRYIILPITFFLLLLYTNACKKSSFLDASPNASLIIPRTVKQYQSILDNYGNMNTFSPSLLEEGADNYYIMQEFFSSLPAAFKDVYTWNDNVWFYESGTILNWNNPYYVIFNANLVLHGIESIDTSPDEEIALNQMKGHALFLRAFYFYQLSQLFAPHYIASTASKDWGIPLRLGIDLNEPIRRSTVQETYDQIIRDLNEAKTLLPQQATVKTRPSQNAVCALLSRIYLVMGLYDSSLHNANACLAIKNTLIDYNNPLVLDQPNDEIIWPATAGSSIVPYYNYTSAAVDTNLLLSYNSSDKRLSVFFENNDLGGKYFKGYYDIAQPPAIQLFTGLATDEIYLIRAECYARLGNKDLALEDLNNLMIRRWMNDGSWTPITAATPAEALDKILIERRKELVFRGLRWSDLRRLNKEGRNITVTRKLDDGTIITLTPNSLLYTYLIPPGTTGFHSDMPQNER